jgi:hypothetical protein
LVYRKNFDIVIYQRREGGILFSGFFVCACVVVVSGHALNTRSSKVVVVNGEYGYVKFNNYK